MKNLSSPMKIKTMKMNNGISGTENYSVWNEKLFGWTCQHVRICYSKEIEIIQTKFLREKGWEKMNKASNFEILEVENM